MIHLIPPISFGDLISMAQSLRVQFPFIPPPPEAMQYWMAATLLRVYVKNEWCDDNLSGASAEPYLTPSSEAAIEGMKVQARIVALGEMVFNLQHVPGSPERIARISNSSLEIAVSELQAAGRGAEVPRNKFRTAARDRERGRCGAASRPRRSIAGYGCSFLACRTSVGSMLPPAM